MKKETIRNLIFVIAAVLAAFLNLQEGTFHTLAFLIPAFLIIGLSLLFSPASGVLHLFGVMIAVFQTFGNVEAWDRISTSSVIDAAGIRFLLLSFFWWFLFSEAAAGILNGLMNRLAIRHRRKMMKPAVFIIGLTVFGFLVFLPYFLAYWPGVANADSMWQIMQARGDLPLNNLLSLFQTLYIRLCLNIGTLFSSDPEAGLAVYCILSMLMMSAVFAYVIWIFYREGLRGLPLILLILFYYLSPINGIYSVTIWKDVPFAWSLLLFSVELWQFFRDPSESSLSCRILLVLSGTLVCLLRSNGFYSVVVCIPFWLLSTRTYWKQLLVFSVIMVGVYEVFTGPVENALKVQRVDFVESLSIPIQQIAYTVTNDGTMTSEEEKQLSKIVDIEQIPDNYVYYISDSMKDLVRATGDVDDLENDKGKYLDLWFSIGKENPAYYLKSFALQTRGYWYFPNGYYWKYLTGITDKVNEDGIYYASPITDDSFNDSVSSVLEFWDKSLYSRFWSISLTSFSFLFLLFYSIHRKSASWKAYLPGMFMLGTLMLATPVSQEFRYAYGLFLTLPAMIAAEAADTGRTAKKKKNRKTNVILAAGAACFLAMILILNSDPDVTPVPHDYTLEVYDDQNNQVSYKGKSFETTVYGLLTEISEKKDFSFTLDKEDGKTIIRTVNGVTADYSKDTSRWAFKIDWGESQYNLTEAIGFPEGTYYSITLVYEKDQW